MVLSSTTRRRAVVALAVLGCAVLSAPAGANDAVTAVNQTQFNAAMTAYGVNTAGVGGCARNPWAAGCPTVTSVVSTLTEIACASDGADVAVEMGGTCDDANSLVMFPYAASYPDPYVASPRGHGTGSACGVRADGPQRLYYTNTLNWYMRGRAINHCLSGQGVSRMEAYVTLQRERLDGREGWTNLDSEAAPVSSGAGWQYTPYATWDCNHHRALLYRVEAVGYSVVRGVGWFGVNRRADYRHCSE